MLLRRPSLLYVNFLSPSLRLGYGLADLTRVANMRIA